MLVMAAAGTFTHVVLGAPIGQHFGPGGSLVALAVFIVIILAVSDHLYRCIERPCRDTIARTAWMQAGIPAGGVRRE